MSREEGGWNPQITWETKHVGIKDEGVFLVTNKRFISVALVLVASVALLVAGCGSGTADKKAEAPKKQILKVGHVFAATHPWTIALEGFAKDVKEATKGEVEIQVFPSSQLGNDRDMAEGMKLGTIEMALIGTGALQSLDKKMIIEELPYAWAKRENAYKALDGDLGKVLNDAMKKQGIIGISFWESGYRHITNSVRPINSVADVKGLKLRVPEAEMRIDTFKILGAMPTPMAFSEVFTALQQKVVDGQENPLATIDSSKFNEVQKHLTLSYHIWGSAYLGISEKAWKKLTPEQQKIIMDKAAAWKLKEREMIKKSESELVAKLKKAGMQVTEPNVAEFQKAVQPVWVKYEGVYGKELIDLVRKYSSQ
jgi:tripartite ATP-independent transporter DctP family solute receptor